MSAILEQRQASISVSVNRPTSIASKSRFWEELEFHRFSFVPFVLVVMACIGGLAAAVAVGKSDWALLAVAFSTGAIEILIMSVAPMRWILFSTAVALLVDLVVFIS